MSAVNHRLRKNLKLLGLFTLIGGAIGLGYSHIVGGQAMYGFIIGCAIVAGVFAFELLFVQQPVGVRIRKLPLPLFITVSSLVWALIIALCLQAIPLLMGEVEAYGQTYQASTFEQDMVFALVVAFVINTMLRIRSLVGGRVLLNFLLGRYYRPVREQRIFLFLDLADSTTMAEELGDLQVQALIGRFFFDIAQPIAEFGGETHRYIGDAIVVTWPISEGRKNAACLNCVFEIQDLIERRSSGYQTDYGLVPRFRAGMHCGSIVASEIGDDKREIVYFGDTINTTARLQALCKEKKSNFLVSGELLALVELPNGTEKSDIGKVRLRGKKEELAVFSLTRNSE